VSDRESHSNSHHSLNQQQQQSAKTTTKTTTVTTTTTTTIYLEDDPNDPNNPIDCECVENIVEIYEKQHNPAPNSVSIDSIKSKTVITPIDLEPNMDEQGSLAKQMNVMKLGSEEIKRNSEEDFKAAVQDYIPKDLRNQKEIYTIGDSNRLSKIESISNDLYDWLTWIQHTMQSNVVTVGNVAEIQQLIQKYQVKFGLLLRFFFNLIVSFLFLI
jgi:hypothetical protein